MCAPNLNAGAPSKPRRPGKNGLQCEKSVKSADRPDSVQPRALRRAAVTAIPLGRLSPERLDATYPHTLPGPGVEQLGKPCHSVCAYLVLLRVEIARFTRT
jgi:hypothetical protein